MEFLALEFLKTLKVSERMINYVDPVGNGILAAQGALANYRELVDSFYTSAANIGGTMFEKIERFPPAATPGSIPWPAFPLTALVSDLQIDQQRWEKQDEYVEWRVTRDAGGQVSTVTFTTELPEYYEALAEVSEAALVAGIQDAIPGAAPTTVELFGSGFDPALATPEDRASRFLARALSPSGGKPANPWNNGDKGILFLLQQFNTTGALFNLVARCAVPNPAIPAANQCAAVGGFCGPSRNSDPRICLAAQQQSRVPLAITLADSPGIHLVNLLGIWRLNGIQFDINDFTANHGIWKIDRSGHRGVLRIPANVTLDGDPVDTGAQVSRFLQVAANVLTVSLGSLLPTVSSGTPLRASVQLGSRNDL